MNTFPKKLFKKFISFAIPKITFSALAKRIFAINLFPLIFFLFLISDLREILIQGKLKELEDQAKGVASKIVDKVGVYPGYVAPGAAYQIPVLTTEKTVLNDLIKKEHLTLQTRIKVFKSDGKMMEDSVNLLPRKPVRREDLFGKDTFMGGIKNSFDNLISWYLYSNFPSYGQIGDLPKEHVQIQAALGGEVSRGVWRKGSRILMTVAAPIKIGITEQVIGSVQLIEDENRVDQALKTQTYKILNYFYLAMAISVLFSLYLWNFIARPLRRLGIRARSIQAQDSKNQEIPDFSSRQDEIGDLSKALREMTEELSNRMDSIKNFSADVAHEIKNPLASLHSAIETVMKVQDKSKKRRLLEIVLDDVSRMDQLITDISDASRIDATLSKEPRKQVNLVSILKKVIGMEIRDKKLNKEKIILKCEKKLNVKIMGIEDRLARAFQNILSNAISFTPENGLIKCFVSIIKKNQIKVLRIMFQDEGSGVPVEKTERIFDRFYTERLSKEKFGIHSGLGLSITKQIIEAHGGTIVAKNIKNRQDEILGSNFIIEIPIEDSNIH